MSTLLSPRLFPIIILILFALAAIRYAAARDWPNAGYWLGAFILNLSVFFLGKS